MVVIFFPSTVAERMKPSLESLPEVFSRTHVCAMSSANALRFSMAVIHCLPLTMFGMELI